MASVALLPQDGGTGLAVLALTGPAPVRNVLGPLPVGWHVPRRASASPKAPLPSFCNAGAALQPGGAFANLCLGLGGCACGYRPCKTTPGLPGCGIPWRNAGVGVGGQPPCGTEGAAALG